MVTKLIAWLTRPTEFQQLRDADEVMRLLVPPKRICGFCYVCMAPNVDMAICDVCWRWGDRNNPWWDDDECV